MSSGQFSYTNPEYGTTTFAALDPNNGKTFADQLSATTGQGLAESRQRISDSLDPTKIMALLKGFYDPKQLEGYFSNYNVPGQTFQGAIEQSSPGMTADQAFDHQIATPSQNIKNMWDKQVAPYTTALGKSLYTQHGAVAADQSRPSVYDANIMAKMYPQQVAMAMGASQGPIATMQQYANSRQNLAALFPQLAANMLQMGGQAAAGAIGNLGNAALGYMGRPVQYAQLQSMPHAAGGIENMVGGGGAGGGTGGSGGGGVSSLPADLTHNEDGSINWGAPPGGPRMSYDQLKSLTDAGYRKAATSTQSGTGSGGNLWDTYGSQFSNGAVSNPFMSGDK